LGSHGFIPHQGSFPGFLRQVEHILASWLLGFSPTSGKARQHLASDGFWSALTEDGQPWPHYRLTCCARLAPEFSACCRDPAWRDRARAILVAKYFKPDQRVRLYTLLGMPVPSEDERACWGFLATKTTITKTEYARRLGFDDRKAQRQLKKFVELGLLRRIGGGRSARYDVVGP
jgi:hypothetical protein